ncbi:MAG: hypothetical protein ACK46O_11960 [Flavobacteriia bacterium]|jgi:methionine-rich copper-binding protein CopC
MKRLLLSFGLIVISLSVHSQTEKTKGHQVFVETNNEQESFPEVEDFKGDFQLKFSEYFKIAISDSFFEYVASNRKENERVELPMSNGSTLIIASKKELDINGFGPFEKPFVIVK